MNCKSPLLLRSVKYVIDANELGKPVHLELRDNATSRIYKSNAIPLSTPRIVEKWDAVSEHAVATRLMSVRTDGVNLELASGGNAQLGRDVTYVQGLLGGVGGCEGAGWFAKDSARTDKTQRYDTQ